MYKYYINPNRYSNPNFNNEVHKEGCTWMPNNPAYLGYFNNGKEAVSYAKTIGYDRADGCAVCCSEAHKG